MTVLGATGCRTAPNIPKFNSSWPKFSNAFGVRNLATHLTFLVYSKHRVNGPQVLTQSRKKNAISRKTIDDLFREYARKAKLPNDKRHAHTFRHSIAVHMLDAAHTQEVKDQLGHKYIQTTDVYAAISGRKRQQIHERMERAREIMSES